MVPAMRRLGRIAFALLGAAIAVSCYAETLTIAETDLVVTVKNPDADYASFRTYALTDTVTDLCSIDPEDIGLGGFGGLAGNGGNDLGCDPLAARFDDVVLDAIETNMNARAYERVALDQDPDVTIVVGAVVRDQWYYVPAYAWCDPYYYYYCWYPSTGYVYEFSTGSILINMIDGASDPGDLESLWFAGLRGLYEQSSEVSGADRIEAMVDRAFAQSPYLAEGGAE
jgi:hypothetical protein